MTGICMDHTIWKKTIKITRTQTIELPKGAKIVHFALQGIDPTIWFLCKPGDRYPTEHVTLLVCFTGASAPDPQHADYIGTVHAVDVGEVYHLFRVK